MSKIIPRNLIKHLEWNPHQEPPKVQPVPTPVSSNPQPLVIPLNLEDYIQVGINGIHRKPALISPFELEGYNDMNYENTHVKLMDNGLYMPTPKIFMTHFMNVVEAHKKRRKLLHADGREVSQDLVADMYEHLTTKHKNVYGGSDIGAWTWLNAQFVRGKGAGNMDLVTITKMTKTKGKKKDKIDFIVEKEPLKKYFASDSYVSLALNEQGLVTEGASSESKYEKGQNIYFYYPRESAVAGFYAMSGGAVLGCNRGSSGTGSSLGVFGCAEGAFAKNVGGSS